MAKEKKELCITLTMQMRDGTDKDYRLQSTEDAKYCYEILSAYDATNHSLVLKALYDGILDRPFTGFVVIKRPHVLSFAISSFYIEENDPNFLLVKPIKEPNFEELNDLSVDDDDNDDSSDES